MGPTKAASGAAVRAHMPSRRLVLRTALTVGVTAGTAGALAPVLARPPEGETSGPELERFDETYRGRSIQGAATATGPASGTGAAAPAGRAAAGAVAAQPDIAVRIDGRPLHVMRRADGSYLSTVNHYESFPTLLETVRAAVDELGSARLSTAFAHSI